MSIIPYVFALVAILAWGSFLNLVAVRLPGMLDRKTYHKGQGVAQDDQANLVRPRSRCPNCHHQLQALDLIPVASYLLLRGRCRHCREPIALQYLLVELLAAVVLLPPFWLLPLTQATAALVAGSILIVLALIDCRHMWLPDVLTYLLLWVGLIISCFDVFVGPQQAIIGAATGFILLWLLKQGFYFLTGKDGVGGGDLKLLAAVGAWLGWQMLPGVLLIGSISALMFVALLMLTKRYKNTQPIAFGPWLALAVWLQLLFNRVL